MHNQPKPVWKHCRTKHCSNSTNITDKACSTKNVPSRNTFCSLLKSLLRMTWAPLAQRGSNKSSCEVFTICTSGKTRQQYETVSLQHVVILLDEQVGTRRLDLQTVQSFRCHRRLVPHHATHTGQHQRQNCSSTCRHYSDTLHTTNTKLTVDADTRKWTANCYPRCGNYSCAENSLWPRLLTGHATDYYSRLTWHWQVTTFAECHSPCRQ